MMPSSQKPTLVLALAGLALLPVNVITYSRHAPANPAASAPSRKARKKQAHHLYKQGQIAFDLGRFEEALERYEQAYRMVAAPGLLFNIGQCHRNLGNYKKAIFNFRLYLSKKKARSKPKIGTRFGA